MKLRKFLAAVTVISILACGIPFSSHADETDSVPSEGGAAADSTETADTSESGSEDVTEPSEDDESTEPGSGEVPEDGENTDPGSGDTPDSSESSENVGDSNESDKNEKPEYTYRITADGKAIINDVTTVRGTFTVPSTVTNNGTVFSVSGVDDFAFGMCENLTAIYVPESLTLEDTGNAAFVTEKSFIKFMNKELGESATIDDFLRYVAKKANYKDGNFTDDDLDHISSQIKSKIEPIDLSKAETLEGKIMTIMKNIDRLDLGPDLSNSFQIWASTITYDGISLCGKPDIPMQQYAEARNFLGMSFVSQNDFILGDANGDGKVNVRDAAYIASQISKGVLISIAENPGADYNQDGKVNVRDAAALARELANKVQ